MAYLYGFTVNALRNIQALDVDLTPDEGREFKHLIITGPNGSGKTSLLNALFFSLNDKRPVASVMSLHLAGAGLTAHRLFQARREPQLENVSSPTAFQPLPHATSKELIQYLVNRKTEQAFASAEGDHESVDAIETWFASVLQRLKGIFEQPALEWSFDRKTYKFTLHHPTGYAHDLTELADGHAAALAILGELLLMEAAQNASGHGNGLSAVALIDEVEAHLHVSLQEQILPLLTSFFPRTQFIVATHSPAVICSIDNALVVDLGHPERRQRSEDLQGIPYGALMTSHFGLANDFDLHSADELKALRALANRADLSAEETAKKNELAGALTRRSPYMALRVWEVLQGVEPTP